MAGRQPQRPALQHREAEHQSLWLGQGSQQGLQLRGQGFLPLLGLSRSYELLQPTLLLPRSRSIEAHVPPRRSVAPLGGQAHQQGPIPQVVPQRSDDAALQEGLRPGALGTGSGPH